jgi:hypothetical protein
MQVDAKQDWQDTGLRPGAQNGAYIVIRATGEWHTRPTDERYGTRNAEGMYDNTTAQYPVSSEGDTNYRYSGPGGLYGQLIGKIGQNGNPFIVGSYCRIEIAGNNSTDTLWLRINDDQLDNNWGSLDVTWSVSDGKDKLAEGSRTVQPRAPYFQDSSGL